MKSFAEYLYYLLPSALKRVAKKLNHYWILFQVLGRHCEEIKNVILDVREQSMILTCPDELLPVFGEERDMPRLYREPIISYRKRLLMKSDIAERAGTRDGIKLALSSLGYEKSYIEPFYLHDPERWAEFLIFLKGDNPSVIDMRIIDAEVMKVKQASSMPAYGIDAGNQLTAFSSLRSGEQYIPLCGTIRCGVYPDIQDVGYMVSSDINAYSSEYIADAGFALTGQTLTAEYCYQDYEKGDEE